jgi:hypothetical protein
VPSAIEDCARVRTVRGLGRTGGNALELEAVLFRDGSASRAVCTGGRRAGPAEDCGGVHAYELIAAATDSTNPDHAEPALELSRFFGDVDAGAVATTPFELTSESLACRIVVTVMLSPSSSGGVFRR